MNEEELAFSITAQGSYSLNYLAEYFGDKYSIKKGAKVNSLYQHILSTFLFKKDTYYLQNYNRNHIKQTMENTIIYSTKVLFKRMY